MPPILPLKKSEAVRKLLTDGVPDREITRRTGVSRSTVFRYRTKGIPEPAKPVNADPRHFSLVEQIDYAYLLGLYLGDGYIGTHRGTRSLCIACDGQHVALVQECLEAMATFTPTKPAIYAEKNSKGVRVVSYGSAWPLLFPQHAPGRKHERKIELLEWQRAIVNEYPRQLLRGLIHSDGSRCTNKVKVNLMNGPMEYFYPRYFFTNYSEDIRNIFTSTCDQLGIHWTQSNWRNISISHRESVARLDTFIGPKT